MPSNPVRRTILPGRRRGCVTVPSSKSIAHRELIAAALSGVEPPVIHGVSRDIDATRSCLAAMMAGQSEWHCGESGSTLRLLTPIAGVMGWHGRFIPEGRLAERPTMPFEPKPRYVVPGNISSQFVSGLLMALPLAGWDSEIAVEGTLQSSSYVDLTEEVLLAAGIRFERPDTSHWRIPGRQRYHIAPRRTVEGDWSQAAFFLAMGDVEILGLRADSRQGDRAAAWLIDSPLVDAAQVPDLVPALAAHAAFCPRVTQFINCGRLRLKESDRLEATAAMVNAVGGRAHVSGESLTIYGQHHLAGGFVQARGDHRIAMSAAVLACGASGPVEVDDATVVAKSYPAFWDDFEKLERSEPQP